MANNGSKGFNQDSNMRGIIDCAKRSSYLSYMPKIVSKVDFSKEVKTITSC